MSHPSIPPGFHSVTPYFTVEDASAAIAFYEKAFGAVERFRLPGTDGTGVGHAEITIGNSILMLSDEFPQFGARSAHSIGGSPVRFTIYVPDVDAAFQRAIDAGCKLVRPVTDMFYGDRAGCVEDPFGLGWTLMTHVRDVSPEEMKRQMAEHLAKTSDSPS
jgi:uncharacterized glyoxalase superfamily protein PhnB